MVSIARVVVSVVASTSCESGSPPPAHAIFVITREMRAVGVTLASETTIAAPCELSTPASETHVAPAATPSMTSHREADTVAMLVSPVAKATSGVTSSDR